MLLMVFAFFFLVTVLCTEGAHWLNFRRYTGKCRALVYDEILFDLNHSLETVERKEADGVFRMVPGTGDRVVGYQPFYHFLFEKGKFQYVFEWTVDGVIYRGHYRYLHRKGKGAWKIGDHVELRYNPKKPWNFALDDRRLWKELCLKVVGYLILMIVGVFLFMYEIG